MKNSAKIHRGFITISLLILLSSLLFVVLLFDEDTFSLHHNIIAQRQDYVAQHFALQSRTKQLMQQNQACDHLELSAAGNVATTAISTEINNTHQQFIWCERQALFKQAPKKNINEGQFVVFIAPEFLPLFQTQLIQNLAFQPKDKQNYVFWFTPTQNEWQLAGNINGIVVAEGDLLIKGKGKISGAVISKGKISTEDNVTISYRKATVTELTQAFSRWQQVEKTWYDYLP
ncbi:hypothetical protein A4G18_02375 [Pasteurellaceae bacterium Pebbles2]|nr:hypothetical protein [Pasteurellaceae bacterium Pebbles2]